MTENAKRGLEDLVPPLELCKRIPEGEFADSALVWNQDGAGSSYVSARGGVHWKGWNRYPAPTLDEILAALADCGKKATAECIPDSEGRHLFTAEIAGTYTRVDRNAATAALRLWMEVNKK